MKGSRSPTAALLMVVAFVPACEPSASPAAGTLDAGARPNASALPAALATEVPELLDAGAPSSEDGGATDAAVDVVRAVTSDGVAPTPLALRPEAPIAAESPVVREVAGVTLDGVFRWREVPAPPKAPEVSLEGIREAQKLTALSWKIDLADTGRMRIEFTSRALPLPAHAEIRARADRYGNLVLWPNASEYRVIPPGALRTVLGERRIDVTPLSNGLMKSQGDGKRFGVATRKVEISSYLGTVRLELAKVPEAGDGGPLLCRALVELGGVDPRSPACQAGEVPVAASYAWQEGGGIAFEVTTLAKRSDLATNSLLVPPPGALHASSGLPTVAHGVFLTKDEISAFRSAALPLPPTTDVTVPGEGFVADNRSDTLAYLLLDGVPVVAVPAASERYVIGPQRGRYVVGWRTFLGEKITQPQTVTMPARLVYGLVSDAGAPDGG